MNKAIPISTLAALLFLAVLSAVGFMASIASAAPQKTPELGFEWKDGAEVYGKVCGLCHETKVGPALRGRGLDPLYIKIFVRNGLRAMPAFRSSEIDDESLEKVAEYVSKTAAGQ